MNILKGGAMGFVDVLSEFLTIFGMDVFSGFLTIIAIIAIAALAVCIASIYENMQ